MKLRFSIGTRSWAAQVWCAAVLTVIAGTPHLSCACPGGQVKPFCFGSASDTMKCCCGGGCCSQREGAPPVSQAEKHVCCCCQAASHAGRTGAAKVESAGCRKALSPSEFKALTPTRTVVGVDLSAGLLPPAPPIGALTFAPVQERSPVGSDSYRPPPTDLVIALQHFLI